MLKDMKAALGTYVKADTSHVRMGIKRFIGRVCTYGSIKYQRANFLRPLGKTPKADFERFRAYLRAAQDHIGETLDVMEKLEASNPDLNNLRDLALACYAADTSPGNEHVGPSNLPHVAHAAASLMMGIQQAIDAGLLPKDPGPAWEDGVPSDWWDEGMEDVAFRVVFRSQPNPEPDDGIRMQFVTATEEWDLNQPRTDPADPPPSDPGRCEHGRFLGVNCAECGGPAHRTV